jgi:hypothetical protein
MGKIREVFAGKRTGSVYGLNFEGAGDERRAAEENLAGAGGAGTPIPERPIVPSQTDTDLAAFRDLLAEQNQQFLGAQFGAITPEQQAATNAQLGGIGTQLGGIGQNVGGIGQNVGSIAQRLSNIGESGIDPAFQQLAQAQIGQLDTQQQAQQATQSQQFSRQGLGLSSASINAQNNLANQFGQQKLNLQSQLGLQGLQRSDLATQQSLGAFGQQAGLFGQQAGLVGQQAGIAQQQFGNIGTQVGSANAAEEARLGALTAGIQNAAIPATLDIALTAAENAGQGGGGGGGKK